MVGIMRERLRRDTDTVHRQLDDAFSLLDLSDPDEYGVFLAANADAYDAVCSALPYTNAFRAEVKTLYGLLTQDIEVLTGRPHQKRLRKALVAPHALGVQYVLAGSHFGKRVLGKRWSRSKNGRVLDAGAFLANDILRALWRTTLLSLEEIHPQNAEADVIVHSARDTFSIFHDSLRAHTA